MLDLSTDAVPAGLRAHFSVLDDLTFVHKGIPSYHKCFLDTPMLTSGMATSIFLKAWY